MNKINKKQKGWEGAKQNFVVMPKPALELAGDLHSSFHQWRN